MRIITVTLIAAIVLVVILLFAVISCNSDSSTGKGDNNAATAKSEMTEIAEKNLIEFKVNGQLVRTSGWNISRFTLGGVSSGKWMNITTNMHDEKRGLNVNLSGAIPGEYFFGGDDNLKMQSYGSFFPDYTGDMSNSFSFTKGAFNIIKIDTVNGILNGSFWGTVKNLKGETLELTEGKIINGSLQPGIMNYQ
jgi:hypothetical protein